METIKPDDTGYDAARTTFVVQGTPNIIFRPQTPQEVGEAIAYAQKNSLILSVKSGGHSNSGFSTNNGGVIIDLSHFTRCELDDNNIAHIGTGNTWMQVADTLNTKGRAISSGDTKSVGVGGLVTGGGIGWMVRQYGLTIDHLVSAEVVTADGSLHSVDREHEPDLFWAIRGGGGNFGVVTEVAIETDAVTEVYAGQLIYDTSNITELVRAWGEIMRQADDALTTIINILPSFMGNPPMVMVGCCYARDDERAAFAALAPLRELGNLQKDGIIRKPFVQVLEEAHPPRGVKILVNNRFYKELDNDVISCIGDALKQKADMILQLRSLGGAMNRVAVDETAFAHRTSKLLIVCPTFLPAAATDEEIRQALVPWEVLAEKGSGMYGNLLSGVGQDITKAMYPGETYQRLTRIKKYYDPENIFNQNHNILP